MYTVKYELTDFGVPWFLCVHRAMSILYFEDFSAWCVPTDI